MKALAWLLLRLPWALGAVAVVLVLVTPVWAWVVLGVWEAFAAVYGGLVLGGGYIWAARRSLTASRGGS